ncbi:MAG: dihydrofolate reductase [bacterium]|nr:MAG: dihydrofolate reductase [bacterium]KAF0148785.1 MAG: dihydrofolate reductase [bacterium]KAF0167353.1 MAG: dihydrofolate reductase [bacterium]TXT16495.1 MAG: dihydrofolate reductase [bacterium]
MPDRATPILSVIAAMARNRVIGVNNTLPWRLPEDLKHFKALTMGHPIIMGRKTFESIGKPLPGRTTVIVTRDSRYRVEGCLIATSIDAAIAACAGEPEIFFVGGAELYAQVLPRADRLYLTEIQADYAGDAWFPAFDRDAWEEMARDRRVSPDGLGYDFVTYRRRC